MHSAPCPRPLAVVIAALPLILLPQGASHAQAIQVAMKEVLVTATRSSQEVEIMPGTVTTVTREEIERRQANDIADLFTDEPDISINSDAKRFGTGGINIRGIEDNRILLLIDGVRTSDYRSGGSTNYTASVRDLPDPDFVKQVEIVRGPGSSLYGSDAIGGVIGFLTLEPDDYLTDGKTQAKGAKLSYFGENAGIKGSAWLAAKGAAMKGLVMVSRLDSRETDNQGDNKVFGFRRTTPNPQDITTTALMAKLSFNPAMGHEFRLGLELKDKQADTDIQRIGNYLPTSPNSLARVTRNTGSDGLTRHKISLDYVHAPTASWYDRLSAKAYWQRQRTDNYNYQLRSNASFNATWGCSSVTAGVGNCDVNQRFKFEQQHLGSSLVMEKAIAGSLPQFLTLGADLSRTTTKETKDTTWTNLATGAVSNKFLGETYPLSEFPKGHMDQLGLFGQDEIHLAGGRLRLTPGLRYDAFKLKPEDDPMFHPAAGFTAVGKSGNRLSPKLLASFEIVPQWHAYGQYVEGYRAPSYEEVNRVFLNNQQNYGSVPNPNLKPETSQGLEFGLKAGGKALGGAVSAFSNTYDDFIESVKLAAGDPSLLPAPYTSTYQYRNLSNVRIHGYELRGHWRARKDLKLSAAYAYAWGEYESTPGVKLPLNSIEPRRITLTALWTPVADLGLETRIRAAAKQSRVDDSSATLFRPGGYAVVDLGGWWQIKRDTRLNVNVGNLFDRKHWLWATARGMNAGDLGPEFYTQPGRNLSASLKVDF